MPEPRILGSGAIVIGAGIGGLAAAAALAPHFNSVKVLDKDELPDEPRVRVGAGQGAHSHTLLKGGELAADRLLPGLRDDLIAAGAAEIRVGEQWRVHEAGAWLPEHDCGFSIVGMSRPGIEHAARRRVQALPNVEIEQGARVRRIVFEAGAAVGVARDPDGAVEPADLIVDASGAGSGLARLLTEAGYEKVAIDELLVKVTYTTGIFEKPADWRGDNTVIYCQPSPPDTRWGVILPIEGERWSVSVASRGQAAPPRDLQSFLKFVQGLAVPDIHARIKSAKLEGQLRSFRKPSVRWRRFDKARALPEAVVATGDALSCFNPTFGQGMTVAFGHACALADALEACAEEGRGLGGLSARYLPAAASLSRRAWRAASHVDLCFPQTEGPRSDDHEMTAAFSDAIRRLAVADPEIYALRMRVANMLESTAAFREGAAGEKIRAEIERRSSAA